MKITKIMLSVVLILATSLFLTSCANSNGKTSVSYSMSVGYGYPMYYGASPYYRGAVVVRPPRRAVHSNVRRR
ncbi:MAG: hypothetical protein MJK12_05255 [Colwellia sp.]|nr:hypothetical protein [Colwellia sp.]